MATAAALAVAVGWFAPAGADTPRVPSAEQVVAGLESWIGGTRDLQGRFTQSLVSGALGADVEESGRLYMKRPGQMRWDYLEPERKLALVRGERTWFYLEEDEQVLLGRLEQQDAWLVTLLLGEGRLTEAFVVGDVHGGEDARGRYWLLSLAPQEQATVAAARVIVRLSQDDYAIEAVEVEDTAGNRVLYRFERLRRNRGLAERLFEFEPPEGVEVLGGS